MASKSVEREKTQIKPRVERKRFLNIIYFIDSHKTQTFKLSIKTAYLSVGLLGLLVSWSFVATLLLVLEKSSNIELRSRSRNLLASLFSYQTRFDGVYERAYPENNGDNLAKNEEPPPSPTDKPQIADAASPATLSKTQASGQPSIGASQESGPEQDAGEALSLPNPKEKLLAQKQQTLQTKDIPIVVENFSFLQNNKNLTVRFALKNTKKGTKATGLVKAEARYFEMGKDGIWLESLSTPGTESTDSSDQDDPSSDHHYNIRFYKNKVFQFEGPDSSTGAFTSVRITVKDEGGKTKEFSYPLNQDQKSLKQTLLEPTEGEDSETESSPP